MGDSEAKVGDSIKSLAACEKLPPGTIVGFAHPIFQGAISAVRWADAHGDLFWMVSGSGQSRTKTRTIKQQYGWAPFVVLALPGEPVLNSEVRVGYRAYGQSKSS
ncbi:hypothetical protein [uncultured Microbacterium sp.]|uniref:hypothetical protein n=1 Tax=uncultured Microbacterium sp. TaxID=191216 RepID=UPI0025E6DE20|nr:hypothetical protein [uncultured Microbacterium sp.]